MHDVRRRRRWPADKGRLRESRSGVLFEVRPRARRLPCPKERCPDRNLAWASAISDQPDEHSSPALSAVFPVRRLQRSRAAQPHLRARPLPAFSPVPASSQVVPTGAPTLHGRPKVRRYKGVPASIPPSSLHPSLHPVFFSSSKSCDFALTLPSSSHCRLRTKTNKRPQIPQIRVCPRSLCHKATKNFGYLKNALLPPSRGDGRCGLGAGHLVGRPSRAPRWTWLTCY